MTEYIFTSPDGKKYRIKGPEGSTREQAFQMLQQRLASTPQEDAPLDVAAEPEPDQPSTDQSESPRGFMPFLNQGISSVLGAPVDLMNAGLGLVGVPVSDQPFLGSESISGGLNRAGVRTAEPTAEPETLGEYIGQGAGSAVGALLPGAGVVGAASRAASPVVRGAAQTLSRPFTRTPLRALAAETAAGAGSGAGMAVADELYPDNITARVVGALAGGGLAGAGPSAAVRTARRLPGVSLAEGLVAGEIAPFTKVGATQRARGRVSGLVEDRDAALTNLARETEEYLSPAAMTGDRRLMALERSVRERNPALDLDMRRAEDVASAGLQRSAREGVGDGTIHDTREFLSGRVQGLLNRIDKRIADAEGRASQALDQARPGMSQSQSSMSVREALESALSEARREETALWNAIPQNVRVSTQGSRDAYSRIRKSLPKSQMSDMPPIATKFLRRGRPTDKAREGADSDDISDIFSKLQMEADEWLSSSGKAPRGFKNTESVKEMHGLYSKLRQEARNARAGDTPNRNRARIADELADAVLADMGSSAQAGGPLRDALDFSRGLNERFTRGSVGRVLGSERTGGERVPDMRTLDATVGRAGRSGAASYDEVVAALTGEGGVPAQQSRALGDYVRGEFMSSAVRDDAVRPTLGQSFLRRNEDLMSRVPDVRSDVVEALAASEAAGRTRQTMTQRARGIERGATSRAITEARAGDEIKGIMRSKSPSATAAQLARQASKDTTGAASSGLKRSVIDDLMGSGATGRLDDAGNPIVSGQKIKARLSDPQYRAVIGEIMSPDEVGRLSRIADELASVEAIRTSDPLAGAVMGDQPNSLVAYVARVLAARSGAQFGQGSSGASLQTAQMASTRMKRILERLTNDKAQQLIEQAIGGDKELFELLLQPVGTITKQQERRIIEALSGTAAQTIGSENE